MLKQVLEFVENEYEEKYEPLNIYLFGSRLYGTQTPQSDFDFIGLFLNI